MKFDGDVVIELLQDAFGAKPLCDGAAAMTCGLPALVDGSADCVSYDLLVVPAHFRGEVSHLRGKLLVLAGPGWTPGMTGGLMSPWLLVPSATPEQAFACLLVAYMRALDWRRCIDELLEEGTSVQQLLDASVEVLGNPLMYYDDQLSDIAYAATREDDEAALSMFGSHRVFREKTVPLDLFDNDLLQEMLSHDGPFVWEGGLADGEQVPQCLNAPICVAGMRAIVGMVPLHGDIKRIHHWYLLELSRAISRHFRNAMPYAGGARLGFHGVVRGLLEGSVDMRIAHRQLLGLADDAQMLMCAVASFSMADGQGMPLAYLAAKVEHVVGDSAVVVDYDGHLVAMLRAASDDELEALVGRFLDAVGAYDVHIGTSTPFRDPLMIAAAYLKACRAIQFAVAREQDERLCRFSDVAVDYILHYGTTELGPRDLMAPGFIRLVDYDADSSVDYCETLRLFFRFGGNVSKVARECSVTRSTLLFRLNQIEQVTNMKLDDPEDLLWLRLSLRLLQV